MYSIRHGAQICSILSPGLSYLALRKVEIRVVDRESNIRALHKEDKVRLGIATSSDYDFICSHDTWRGYPRVICCMEKLAKLDRLARPGAIRHEAAHSA